MENITLSSSLRTNLGKGSARTIRRTGLIPAIYYREGREPTLITINPRLLQLSFDKSGNPNHLVNIEIDGKVAATCLVKDVQRHPVTGNIRHVDFYQVEKDEVITISVPIEIVGKSIGVQMGGDLRTIRRTVDVTCKPGDIPATIQFYANCFTAEFTAKCTLGRSMGRVQLQEFMAATFLGPFQPFPCSVSFAGCCRMFLSAVRCA